MKNLIQFTLLTLFLAFGFSSLGQAPEGINYQATVRNSSGALMTSQSVTVVFAIRQSSTIGAIIYQENHTVTTNAYGGFNAIIGSGTATTGTFSSINWGTGTYYLSVTVNGNNLGTTQLLSVPYALYSKTSGSSTPGPTGATGPQGPAGATGNTGATGPQGPQGVAGPAGASGTNGTNGTNGAVGPQGPIGLTGPAGSQGPQGIAGAQGATGPQGTAGTNGVNGLDGKTIYNGISSPSSSLGTVGDFYINTNSSEIYGPKTVSGWGAGTSLIGNAGPAGANGATGAQGPQGIAGPAGANGTNGSVGPQGPIGLTGPAGSQGPQGIQGAAGPQGPAASDDQDIDSVTLNGNILTVYISNGNSASVTLDSSSGLFENQNGTIRQKGGYDSTNFLFGSPQINDDGTITNGNKFFFSKEKGAFRAGTSNYDDGTIEYTTNNWDIDSLGLGSFGAGTGTKAIGNFSTAMGFMTKATEEYSTATGIYSEATGGGSTAMGSSTVASGTASTSMGSGTTASGRFSTAIGYETVASGESSVALGANSQSTGLFSMAYGVATKAEGQLSTASGWYTEALGYGSTSMGSETKANNSVSVAMGQHTQANGNSSLVIGLLNDTLISNDNSVSDSTPLFIVGNGDFNTWPVTRSNAFTVFYNGKVTINDEYSLPLLDGDSNQIMTTDGNGNIGWEDNEEIFENQNGTIRQKGGYDTTNFLFGSPQMDDDGDTDHDSRMFFNKEKGAFRVGMVFNNNWDEDSLGFRSFASGYSTKAIGNNSTAMGYRTNAIGIESTAIGNQTWSFGNSSLTMGSFTRALGNYSTAIGAYTRAIGIYSTAMGRNTEASGDYSTAMGHSTDAIGDYSTAMGRYTNAIGNYSTAMGTSTIATGDYSTAMGRYTNAIGNYSTAMGRRTYANTDYSTALGNYNDTTTSSTGLIFSIGNGTSSMNRINTMHIFQSSNNAYFRGSVYPMVNNTANLGSGFYRWNTVYATNGVINTSDTTLKTNITPLSYGLADLMKIKTISYNWKDDERQIRKIGFNAQNLLQVIPEVVQTHSEQTNEDTGEVTYEENETLGVFYSDMIPVLTKSIQEQQAIIENQETENQKQAKQLENEKTQNEKQEEELAKLKKEMEELKKQLQLLLDNKEEK